MDLPLQFCFSPTSLLDGDAMPFPGFVPVRIADSNLSALSGVNSVCWFVVLILI